MDRQFLYHNKKIAILYQGCCSTAKVVAVNVIDAEHVPTRDIPNISPNTTLCMHLSSNQIVCHFWAIGKEVKIRGRQGK